MLLAHFKSSGGYGVDMWINVDAVVKIRGTIPSEDGLTAIFLIDGSKQFVAEPPTAVKTILESAK